MANPREAPRPLPPNVTELRMRIDRRRTGDKAPGAVSSAAPMGTDDEAAETPDGPVPHRPVLHRPAPDRPAPDRPVVVAQALREETDLGRDRPAPGSTPAPEDSGAPDVDPGRPRGNFWFALAAVVIALALVYLIWRARR